MTKSICKTGCRWTGHGIHQRYRDAKRGVPLHVDRRLFEFLLPDRAQTGLSRATIPYVKPAYRRAFERFSPDKIFRYTKGDVDSLLKDPGPERSCGVLKASGTSHLRRNVRVAAKAHHVYGTQLPFPKYTYRVLARAHVFFLVPARVAHGVPHADKIIQDRIVAVVFAHLDAIV